MQKPVTLSLLASTFLFFGSLETKAQVVVYLGDSHSVYSNRLGPVLANSILSNGDDLQMIASCGARIQHYASGGYKSKCGYWRKSRAEDTRVPWKTTAPPTPSLSDFLREKNIRNGLLVVQLGSNHLGDSAQGVFAALTKLLAARGSLDCLVIGPPHSRCHSESLRTIAQAMRDASSKSGCSFIDSLALTKDLPTSADCLHLTPSSSETWGQRILSERTFRER